MGTYVLFHIISAEFFLADDAEPFVHVGSTGFRTYEEAEETIMFLAEQGYRPEGTTFTIAEFTTETV